MSNHIVLTASEAAKIAARERLVHAQKDYSNQLLQQRHQAETTKERRKITAALFVVLTSKKARRLLNGTRKKERLHPAARKIKQM